MQKLWPFYETRSKLSGLAIYVADEFGAQSSRDMLWVNRRYRCNRGGSVVLSGLTDQNSDSPGIQNLRAHNVLGKMPKLILVDSRVDPNWN